MKLEDKMDTNDLGGGKPSEWWTAQEKERDRARRPKRYTPVPLERVWLLRLEQKQDGPNECRRAVEGVALSEEDARMWEAESGEYWHTAEEVPVWHPAMMMVSGDVDLDDPEIAEAMEATR